MIRISVAVMHAPRAVERRAMVAAIREQLDATIIEERGLGAWDTARRAWSTIDGRASHHLVLQDDARLCDDFAEHATDAITTRPTEAISFFSRGATGAPWFTCAGRTMVATCLPVALAREWSAWMHGPHVNPDDTLLVSWLRSRGIVRWFTNPSLVQHGDAPSLLGHPDGIRSESFRQRPGVVDWTST